MSDTAADLLARALQDIERCRADRLATEATNDYVWQMASTLAQRVAQLESEIATLRADADASSSA